MKHSLVFVATTPFAVNAFLRTHLVALARIYDVTLCVNTELYPLVDEIARSVRVLHVDMAREIAPWRDLRALFQLWRCLISLRPSVVHSMTPKAGLLAMLAGLLAGIPLRFHTFTGQVWATKTGLARYLLKMIDRLVVAAATRVFADSVSQCRLLEHEAVVRLGGISVLGAGSVAGVDCVRFCPDLSRRSELRAALGIAETVPVFLFVGRLVRDKGVVDLIEAFTKLISVHPDLVLWLVGPDEQGLQSRLQSSKTPCAQGIRWIGATSEPERYMAAADILVLPSYREGFGSVVIEAAACGIPTIAYRIDGIVDAVVHGETGCLVPVGNVPALAEAMLQLAHHHEERQRLGQRGLARVNSDFRSEALTAAWLTFYQQVLHREAFL
ncbi:MAG: glycosyltransferase family 4 protein [Pseudomonadota bacterium]